MPRSKGEYLEALRLLHGEDAIAYDKITEDSQDLVAIGWHWNLRKEVWNVGPKRRGLFKMYMAIFHLIRPDDTCIHSARVFLRRVLLHVSSLLMWYSVVLPMGRSFILSILRCAGPEDSRGRLRCILTEQAKSDIEWWRVIIVLALKKVEIS
jgi:hypothetical protein